MGVNDRRRYAAFADFLHRTYPDAIAIADVGGGRGTLSYRLREHGHETTIVDTRDARHPRWVYRALRKGFLREGKPAEIPRIIAAVQDVDMRAFDLLVGLHPDEATEPIVRAAIEHGKDFAIVPCCVFPLDGVKRSQVEWREYLASLSPGVKTATLPIHGSNVVLYRTECSSPVA